MNNTGKFKNFLDKMQGLIDNAKKQGYVIVPIEDIENTFPELKENEDEKMMKCMKYAVDYLFESKKEKYICDTCKDKVVAWLEKQGEQKPADKVEPKFKVKVGDWLQYRNAKPFFVEEITKQGYVNGDSCLPFNWENEIHLWTVQDAKDGDVLAFDNDTIVIFKNLYNSTTFHSYCHIEDGVFDVSKDILPDWWEGKGFYPATKEQRDLLFQKMHEAGYMWDSESKQLLSLEAKPSVEKKNAWSEEDKDFMYDTLSNLKELKDKYGEGYGNVGKCIDWLKSFSPQNRWKPSKEQIKALRWVLNNIPYNKHKEEISALLEQIKDL